ncbi:hypothetical protein ACVXG7_25590 [Enterobacter hormaechei]
MFPSNINFAAITTIVGCIVGGYISYAGADRLLDKGISGEEHIKEVSSAANRGIIVVGIMRYVLFLGGFWRGCQWVTDRFLQPQCVNPASQAFLLQPVVLACVFSVLYCGPQHFPAW